MASQVSDDIVIQGSRTEGTARPNPGTDIAIRVDEETFSGHIAKSFKPPNPDSAKEKTMLHAIETGKIQGGESKLRPLRRQLEKILGIDVDVSIILQQGPFDGPHSLMVD